MITALEMLMHKQFFYSDVGSNFGVHHVHVWLFSNLLLGNRTLAEAETFLEYLSSFYNLMYKKQGFLNTLKESSRQHA